MNNQNISHAPARFKRLPPSLEETRYQGVCGECGSLDMFLSALKYGAVIWMMPLDRTITTAGSLCHQRIVHLTARGPEHDRPVYYATIWSNEVSTLGRHARILYPYRRDLSMPEALQFPQDLQHEQLECLIQALEVDIRVMSVMTPARYRIPDAWVWGVSSSLEGSGIVFQDEHWQYQPAVRARSDTHSE